IEVGGRTARSQRSRAGRKALPSGASRLVEVYVRIYDSGEDVQPGCVYFRVGRALDTRRDLRDLPSDDAQVELHATGGRDQSAISDSEIIVGHFKRWSPRSGSSPRWRQLRRVGPPTRR